MLNTIYYDTVKETNSCRCCNQPTNWTIIVDGNYTVYDFICVFCMQQLIQDAKQIIEICTNRGIIKNRKK